MAKETGQAQELWGIRQACRAELRVYVSGIAGGDGGLGCGSWCCRLVVVGGWMGRLALINEPEAPDQLPHTVPNPADPLRGEGKSTSCSPFFMTGRGAGAAADTTAAQIHHANGLIHYPPRYAHMASPCLPPPPHVPPPPHKHTTMFTAFKTH